MGLEGLAILRSGTTATDDELAAHIAGLFAPRDTDDPESLREVAGRELDVAAGYARWAEVYDDPSSLFVAEFVPKPAPDGNAEAKLRPLDE